jgi:hypothetical protein
MACDGARGDRLFEYAVGPSEVPPAYHREARQDHFGLDGDALEPGQVRFYQLGVACFS